MKIIQISELSAQHEGLLVGFDCPYEITREHDGKYYTHGRPVNTELEWRYQGRNNIDNEPGVGVFRHVHSGLWIKIHLTNPLVVDQRIWVEESPTEKLIAEVSEHLRSRADIQGKVMVEVRDATGGHRFYRGER